MKNINKYINLKKLFLILAFLPLSFAGFGQSQEYSSIEEVKKLNFELFQEIGLDENKMNHVCRVIYSTQKRSAYMKKYNDPGIKKDLDSQYKLMMLRVLSEEEYKRLESIKHKIK